MAEWSVGLEVLWSGLTSPKHLVNAHVVKEESRKRVLTQLSWVGRSTDGSWASRCRSLALTPEPEYLNSQP